MMARVTAIVTVMTEKERSFASETIGAILADPCINQILVCVHETNSWIEENPRLEIVRLPMMPAGAARNRGVERAKCEWIAFCDGDDVWLPGKTETLLKVAKKSDVVACCHFLMDEDGSIRANGFAKTIPMTSSWMVKKSVMDAFPFSETLRSREDNDWWYRTRSCMRTRCPERLIKYRVRSDSLSSAEPSKRRKVRFMRLARIPVLGATIYLLTWLRWRSLCSKTKY